MRWITINKLMTKSAQWVHDFFVHFYFMSEPFWCTICSENEISTFFVPYTLGELTPKITRCCSTDFGVRAQNAKIRSIWTHFALFKLWIFHFTLVPFIVVRQIVSIFNSLVPKMCCTAITFFQCWNKANFNFPIWELFNFHPLA